VVPSFFWRRSKTSWQLETRDLYVFWKVSSDERVILIPLQHLTDPSIPAPRSSDETFQNTYKSLVSKFLLEEIQDLVAVGDERLVRVLEGLIR
jgi:hypothetical protein